MGYIYAFLLSMAPFCELRCSIPVGMESFEIRWVGTIGYDLPWYGVLPVALIGNLVPGVFWLLALPRIGRFLTSFSNPLGRFLTWRSQQIRRKNLRRFDRHGSLALTILVAIPLPITGVWSGCLAAWAFEIPFRRALPPIALGALIAGILVTGLTSLGIFVAD